MNLSVDVAIERWPLIEPFVIARDVMADVPLVHVTLRDAEGREGHAEAAGVDYDGETPETMAAAIRSVAALLRADIDAVSLNALLPIGGARNAIDCALWDLRAKQTGIPAWRSAELTAIQPLVTAVTIGLGTLDDTRRRARAVAAMPLIKLKLDDTRHIDHVRLVRDIVPAARIIIDANEGWTPALLEQWLPAMAAERVELIEQPLPRGADAMLDGLMPPVPIAADESCTDLASLNELVGRYQAVNVKLDKCGGLTEALALARAARALGLDVMVGNMCGTSLGMAPAFLVAQLARWADLDGPLLQRTDRAHPMRYEGGLIHPPSPQLWG